MTKIIPILFVVVACATAPKSASDKADLQQQANSTLAMMMQRDSGLQGMLERSAGYAVFPNIGKGGLVAGAAYGRGVLYQRGQPIGYVDLSQGSLGLQAGAQAFSELIVFETDANVQRIRGGSYSLGGNVSAVALTAGAAASTTFRDGVAVFVVPKGGAMAELSVSGQKINYQPLGG